MFQAQLLAAVSNTFDIHVTLQQYAYGWDAVYVPYDGVTQHLGGLQWNITYLRIPGDVNNAAFPPGAGTPPPMGATLNTLSGTSAGIAVVTPPALTGSPIMTCTFTAQGCLLLSLVILSLLPAAVVIVCPSQCR